MSATRDSFRVLHVDDEPDFADTAGDLLECEDGRITVLTATSASDGLEILATEEIECVISDYDMPGQNGIEFLEAVRSSHPDLPFILFTGQGSEAIASDAISAGISDYLQKSGGTDQYAVLANRIVNLVEKYRAERARERHNVLIQEATEAIFVVGEAATIQYVTPSSEAILGRTPEELVGRHSFEMIHPEDRPYVVEEFSTLVENSGGSRTVEFRYEWPDGSWVWMEARGHNLLDKPLVNGIVVYTRDITEQKEQEQALERERDRLQAIFERSFDPMIIVDDERRFIEVNDRATELFGLSETELRERPIEDFAPDEFDMECAWTEFQTSGKERGTFPLVRPDGTTRIVEYAATADITPGEHLSILRDITDREEREQELKRYERIVNTMEEAACIYDRNGRFKLVNEALAEFYGTTPASLTGEPSHLIPRIRDQVDGDPYRELLNGERGDFQGELEGNFPGLGYAIVAYRLVPLEIDGSIEGVVGVAREITEDRRREAELERQNERLDQFANFVSHDLRNPLNVAEARLEFAQAECSSEHLEVVERAHDRMRMLIEDMLTLAQDGIHVTDTEFVVLPELVRECWKTIKTPEMTLAVETEQTIQADASRLYQLLVNLLRNAITYGRSTVTVGDLNGGFYVADDGPGIPPTQREHVFKSGYSGSEDGHGFGLAIVREVAEGHGWQVRLSESDAGGARFEITGIDDPDL